MGPKKVKLSFGLTHLIECRKNLTRGGIDRTIFMTISKQLQKKVLPVTSPSSLVILRYGFINAI